MKVWGHIAKIMSFMFIQRERNGGFKLIQHQMFRAIN